MNKAFRQGEHDVSEDKVNGNNLWSCIDEDEAEILKLGLIAHPELSELVSRNLRVFDSSTQLKKAVFLAAMGKEEALLALMSEQDRYNRLIERLRNYVDA